jgi:hypothetical protein
MTTEELAGLTTHARAEINAPLPRFDVLLPASALTSMVHTWRRLAMELTDAIAQLAWTRVDEPRWYGDKDHKPRWELSPELGADVVTDETICHYGRQLTESTVLAGLPPLPEKAWEVLS